MLGTEGKHLFGSIGNVAQLEGGMHFPIRELGEELAGFIRRAEDGFKAIRGLLKAGSCGEGECCGFFAEADNLLCELLKPDPNCYFGNMLERFTETPEEASCA